MVKLQPGLRQRFKTLITIIAATAEGVEVSRNSAGPGSANAFDEIRQFRQDIVPPTSVKSTVPGCKTREALIIHRMLDAAPFCFFFSCSECYL